MMNQKYTNVKILPIPSNFVEIKRILTLKIKHLKYKLRTNWEKTSWAVYTWMRPLMYQNIKILMQILHFC